MMDAMISRCVDDLNKEDEEFQRIRMRQDPSARSLWQHNTFHPASRFLIITNDR